MRSQSIDALVRACVLCMAAPCAAAASDGWAAFGGLSLSQVAMEEHEPGRLTGLDAWVGLGPREPLCLILGGSLHFAGSSRYTLDGQDVERTLFQAYVGPALLTERRHVRFFAHALTGYIALSYEDPGIHPDSLVSGALADARRPRPARVSGYAGGAPALAPLGGIAFTLGGGVDLLLSDQSAIRIQADYTSSRLALARVQSPPGVPDPIYPAGHRALIDLVVRDHRGWTHGFRVGAGYVYTGKLRPRGSRSPARRTRWVNRTGPRD